MAKTVPQGDADHIVPDLLAPDLKLIFCGTAPSEASAKARAYYAKPGNVFWQTLHRTGITPRLFQPTDYPRLLMLGIGLTDVCKTASGNDDELPDAHIDCGAVRSKIMKYQPRILAFTSKKSASLFLGRKVEYGLQEETVGNTKIFVLPSTSGRARRFFREEVWKELAGMVQRLSSRV